MCFFKSKVKKIQLRKGKKMNTTIIDQKNKSKLKKAVLASMLFINRKVF